MTDYVVNSSPLQEIYEHHEQPQGVDFDCDHFKNIDYSRLSDFRISQYCKRIVDVMYAHIVTHLKHQYVFIKIQDLKKGEQTSGTGHWHLDSSLNPVDHYENYIFTSGLHNNTEFFKSPLIVKHAKTSAHFNQQVKAVYNPSRDSFILKPLTVYRYAGSNVHRGRLVTVPEKRILIRLSNTDTKLTVYK